jgi:hypothetical protein
VVTVDTQPVRVSLPRAGCLSLLEPGGHGRLAASMRAVPVIIPVTFSLRDDVVVFALGPGEGLSRAVAGCVVAFETDAVAADGRIVWDVHVTGVAAVLPVEPGAPAFRLSTEIITGWRIAR